MGNWVPRGGRATRTLRPRDVPWFQSCQLELVLVIGVERDYLCWQNPYA
jgi:hypothetical protein